MALNAVLFVDDDEMVCEMYRGFSHILQEHYDIETSLSAEQGLARMKARKFDVVVTDLTMPEMDGMKFLAQAMKLQPDCARIIISGYADRIKVARCLFVGHRYFDKPCDVSMLAELLLRLASFRTLVANPKIRKMIGGLGALPGPPETFLRIEKTLEDPRASMHDVAEVVEHDVNVTAKLLQVVNSAQFGLRAKVVSVAEAVQIAGVEAVRGLVLGLQMFSDNKELPKKKSAPSALWDHSLRVGLAARKLARLRRLPMKTCDRAFLAGLLHDSGRVVIESNAAEDYAEVQAFAQQFGLPLAEAEVRQFGASHAEIGGYLLSLWGIDDEVVRIVQHQDKLSEYSGNDPAAAACLHVAHYSDAQNPQAYPLDIIGLSKLGFVEAEDWVSDLAMMAAD